MKSIRSFLSLTVCLFLVHATSQGAVVLSSGESKDFDFSTTTATASFDLTSGMDQVLMVAIGMEHLNAQPASGDYFASGTWTVGGDTQNFSVIEGVGQDDTFGAVLYLQNPLAGTGTISITTATSSGKNSVPGSVFTATGVASIATAFTGGGANNTPGSGTLDFGATLPGGSAVVAGSNVNGGSADTLTFTPTSGTATFTGSSANAGSSYNHFSTSTDASGDLVLTVEASDRFGTGAVALLAVPEPSAVTLLGLGGLLLLAIRRRR